MAFNSLESSLLDAQRENYIGVLKGSIPVADNGWSTYFNTPVGTSPSSGIGGIAYSILSLDIISPMSGDSDLRFAKDASNRQGEGFGYFFSINRSHLGRVLQISFDAELISENNTYENPIFTPISGTYTINSTTCTVTASHSFLQGQVVNMTFGGSTPPANGFYTITSVTATTFVFTIASGSGTNVACSYTTIGDLRVFIIQDPMGTPVAIEPVNVNIQLGTQNQRVRHIATFQTHISITSYRLCIHVGSASTVAYTVDFANFRVWEQQQSLGAVITDWVSYIPTISGTSSNPTKATTAVESAKWRRVGSQMEIRYSYYHTSSTGTNAGSGDYLWSIPSGFSIDSSVVPNSTSSVQARSHLGEFICSNGGDTSSGQLRAYDSTRLILRFNSGSPASAVSSSTYNIANTVIEYSFTAFVPIAGWGSNVAMSSDSGDGRVVSAIYKNLVGSLNTQYGFQWNSRVIDTHNAVSQTGSSPNARTVFTAPVNGFYQVSAFVLCSNSGYVDIYKNDSIYARISGTENTTYGDSISFTISLNAGENFYIRTMNMTSTSTSTSDGQFSVFRISAGSQIIASSEGVSASYYSAATQTSLTTQINFGTRVYDTHGAVTTGSSWKFTAPMSGKYLVTYMLGASTTSSQYIEVWKTGSFDRRNINGGATHGSSSFQLNLLAGEYFDLRPNSSMTVSGSSSNDGNRSFIEITRIGN